MKGGLKITRIPSPGNSCTAGFIVRRALNGAQLSVLTAGHCLYDTSGNNNVNFLWKHNGSQFGDSKYHTWGPEKGADVGLVEIDNNSADMPTSANKMWLYNGTSGAIYTITYATPSQYQTAGVQACAYGYFSNDSECGVILSEYNVRNLSRAWGINNYITNTWEYDINLVSGDSGGPIYQVLSGTSRAALGTHVHSDDDPNSNGIGWYSPWDVGRTYYINYTPDSFEMCITAAC